MYSNKAYTVSDGQMVLILEPAAEGGYVVTSPFDPELITEANSAKLTYTPIPPPDALGKSG